MSIPTALSPVLPVLGSIARRLHPALTEEDLVASLERPRQAEHGDWSWTIALRLAKSFGQKPRDLGQVLLAAVNDEPALRAHIRRAELAGPGFINFWVSEAARSAVLEAILAASDRYGAQPQGTRAPVLVEFVSANPTGPLHVGHGRQAALGDVLSNILAHQGAAVTREFYYNDAGAQIDNLARSVQARAAGMLPTDPHFPADGYRGDYIADIAQAYLAKATVQARDGRAVTGEGNPNNLEAIRQFAVAYLRHEQDLDLQAFGVEFDVFSLESALYSAGHVDSVVQRLEASGHAYAHEGALWLRSTDYGDDKDRVMRKSDGGYTYFVPDVAYHEQKFLRGFPTAINIQGSDHHGTMARVRAGLKALGLPLQDPYPEYLLHKMVTVMRGGEEVKISKRAGAYVTLRDLIVWSSGADSTDLQRGRDVVRTLLVSRKADSEFVFDLDVALASTDENPVFSIQYAHARICAIFRQAGQSPEELEDDLRSLSEDRRLALRALLVEPITAGLMAALEAFPAMLARAADERAPHHLPHALRELAGELHSLYAQVRILVDDPELRRARLWLLASALRVLRIGTQLLGVRAPEHMDATRLG